MFFPNLFYYFAWKLLKKIITVFDYKKVNIYTFVSWENYVIELRWSQQNDAAHSCTGQLL